MSFGFNVVCKVITGFVVGVEYDGFVYPSVAISLGFVVLEFHFNIYN